jgi:hypothetical protein
LVALTYALRVIIEALLLMEVAFNRDEAGELLEVNEGYKRELTFSIGTLKESIGTSSTNPVNAQRVPKLAPAAPA